MPADLQRRLPRQLDIVDVDRSRIGVRRLPAALLHLRLEIPYRPDVRPRKDPQTAVPALRPGEVVHEFDVVVFGVAMPLEAASGGQLVDAAIAKVDVPVVRQLARQLDDFGVQLDLQKAQGVVQITPVGARHLGFQAVVVASAVGGVVLGIDGHLVDRREARGRQLLGKRAIDDDVAFSPVLLQLGGIEFQCLYL